MAAGGDAEREQRAHVAGSLLTVFSKLGTRSPSGRVNSGLGKINSAAWLVNVAWLVVSGLLAGGSTAAAQPGPAAHAADPPSRAIPLHNLGNQPVVSALARTTDGRTRVLTYEPIQPGQTRWIVLPQRQCLASVTVHLNDGRALTSEGLNECQAARIVVGDGGIEIRSGTRPGRSAPH